MPPYCYDLHNELHNAKHYTPGNHQPAHNHIILLIMSSVTAYIIPLIMSSVTAHIILLIMDSHALQHYKVNNQFWTD